MKEEIIAELEHEQWMHWSKSLATRLVSCVEILEDPCGEEETAEEKCFKVKNMLQQVIDNWQKDWKPYKELDHGTKELDRIWARKVLAKGLFLSKQQIEDMLWIPCCHTSGIHNPTHFSEKKYICSDQCKKALIRFCKEIGINPRTKSDPKCGWCNDYQEKKKGEGLCLL